MAESEALHTMLEHVLRRWQERRQAALEDWQETFEKLDDEIRAWLDEVCSAAHKEEETLTDYMTQPGWLIAQCARHPDHATIRAYLQRLYARCPDINALQTQIADAYFQINACMIRVEARLPPSLDLVQNKQQSPRWWSLLKAMRVLNACLAETPPPDICERIEAHAQHIVEMLDAQANRVYRASAGIQDVLNLVLGLSPSERLFSLIEHLRPVAPWMPGTTWSYFISYTSPYQQTLLRAAFLCEMLTYELFRQVALLMPEEMMRGLFNETDSAAFRECIGTYRRALLTEVAHKLDENNCRIILAYEEPLHGPSWLLEAARLYTEIRPGKLIGVGKYDSPRTVAQAIIRLARASECEPSSDVERAELLTQLQQFPPATLKALFAVATHTRQLLCEALHWQKAIPLVVCVEELAVQHFQCHETTTPDIPNSIDPQSGIMDVHLLRPLLEQVGSPLAQEVLTLLVQGKAGVENTAFLVSAIGGWNRANVLKGLKRYGQISIKAFGLLPLSRGEDEVLERYLELQRIARQGQQFGQGRRATHAAAVHVARANLAQVGGYSDAAQLEWEMEAKVIQDAAIAERVWTVGKYQLQVVLDGIQASIHVTRAGHALKSLPKEVRSSTAYQEAKETVAQLRAHIGRLRRGLLERLLESGEVLSLTQLTHILAMPTARVALEKLLLQDADGTIGLLDTKKLALRSLDQVLHPIRTAVTIVHPYTLSQLDIHSAWQHEIVRLRIIQPVKQVFRELYVLTPAEQEACTTSQRFAGHAVNGNTAIRLLTGRNWLMRRHRYEDTYAYKLFPGMRAVFTLSTTGHYLGEPGSEATTGMIYFERRSAVSSPQAERQMIPLAEIPPLIFSEVMRDADLVVSVAQTPQNREGYYSYEAATRVSELLLTLLDDLHLHDVTVDGHFAYVQGKLTRYRVHLGSGAIHIEPGSYLCIVPANWGQQHEDLFLPFADDGSTKTAEIVSKILLLLNDDQITDESILRQIRSTIAARG